MRAGVGDVQMIRMTRAVFAAAAVLAGAGFAGTASADAVIGASQTALVTPDTGYPGGLGGFLTVNFETAAPNHGLLQFDLSGESGTAIGAAVFLHHVFNQATAEFGLFRLTSAWSANTVTFSTAPTFDPTPVSTRSFTLLNGPDELEAFDVTDVVNGWLGGAYANHGLALMRLDDPNPFLYFAAVDSATQRAPVLSVVGTSTRTLGGVPEPGAGALMILGFGAAGAGLRRSRRRLAA